MADAAPSAQAQLQQGPDDVSESARSGPGELEALREETRRLRQLVVQLSRIAIKNAVNMK